MVTIQKIGMSKKLLVYPRATNRKPLSKDVPQNQQDDYTEASLVLPVSPKASATLSRRCLQGVLHSMGYKAANLAKEIELLLNEPDPIKAIPGSLRTTIDMVRHFGNFSAHPTPDKNTMEIIDVEDGEAEYCLDVLDAVFDHFYVKPAEAQRLKDALNAKLVNAGKPPAK